jgi:hypothetical protein
MAQFDESDEIEAAAARILVGKAIFGDDWIGPLSQRELDLLSGPSGPQRKILPNGRVINIIPPCPANLRGKLDLAIGRAERAYLQEAMTIDVMHEAGFTDVAKRFDRDRVHEFLKKINQPKSQSNKRPAGKPRDLIDGVILRMASDVRRGVGVESMKGKELAAKYGVSRGTAVNARKELFEKRSRK